MDAIDRDDNGVAISIYGHPIAESEEDVKSVLWAKRRYIKIVVDDLNERFEGKFNWQNPLLLCLNLKYVRQHFRRVMTDDAVFSYVIEG